MTCRPPVEDPVYRAIIAARRDLTLDGPVWSSAFGGRTSIRTRCRIRGLHYRPFVRARLWIETTIAGPTGGSVRQFHFARIYPGPVDARRRFARELAKSPLECHGPPVFLHAPWNAVVWALPNGPRLRRARVCMDPGRFDRLLAANGLPRPSPGPWASPEMVRYVPRKRALFRYCEPGAPKLYVKLYASGADRAAVEHLNRVGAGHLAFRTPRVLAHDRRHHAVVMDELPGAPLSERYTSIDPPPYEAIGAALASLHASPVTPAGEWSAGAELADLRRAMDDVGRALPAVAGRVGPLVEHLERRLGTLDFHERTPIHGNLFGDQILVDGDDVGIVDWDDFQSGDPLFDLGRLGADLVFCSASAALGRATFGTLLYAYEKARRRRVDRARLLWHLTVALLMRAKISALRPLPDDWMERIHASIEEAEGMVDGGSPWGAA